MKTALVAAALVVSPVALADTTQPVQSAAVTSIAAQVEGRGFHETMYRRYCEKLHEGPEAYAAFVKRMATVTGYTYTDFAPGAATGPVRYACRDANAALAAREQRGG